MSVESIKRISESYTAQIEEACSNGQGYLLFDCFIRDMAADFASSVFLKIEAEAAKVTSDSADELWEWLQWFPESSGLTFIDSVTSTMTSFNAATSQIEKAQLSAATAFQEQLNSLFETAREGGCA